MHACMSRFGSSITLASPRSYGCIFAALPASASQLFLRSPLSRIVFPLLVESKIPAKRHALPACCARFVRKADSTRLSVSGRGGVERRWDGLKWARVFFNRIAGQLCWVSCLTTFTAFFLLLLRITVVRFTLCHQRAERKYCYRNYY